MGLFYLGLGGAVSSSCHLFGSGLGVGSLSATALFASCFPVRSEDEKRDSKLNLGVFFDGHKNRDTCKFCVLPDKGLAQTGLLATGSSPLSSEESLGERL